MNLRALPSTDQYDSAFVEEDDGRERVLVVEAGGELYAIHVAGVREVLRARGVTRVPGAPPAMLGLVNVRGMVVTVLDLQACLRTAVPLEMKSAVNVTVSRTEMGGSIVLLERGSRVVGLAVDAVQDVRLLDDASANAESTEAMSGNFSPGMIQNVTRASGDLVMVLDVAALFARHLLSSAET